MWKPNSWSIFRGEDEQIVVHVLDEDGDPTSISGASEIKLLLKKADGSIFEKTAISGFSAGIARPIWIYAYSLTAEETELLPVAANQTVQLRIKYGALVRFIELKQALTVRNAPVST